MHDNALRVVGRMVAAGRDDEYIRACFVSVLPRIAEARGDDRAQALMGELDRMISGAREKGFDGQATDSEIALSARYAECVAGRFRWSPGLDWMRNAGEHWERDEAAGRLTAAKAMLSEFSREAKLTPDKRRSIASARTVGAVLTLARTEAGIVTPADAWDRDPMVLNTPGGAYDLETGKRLAVVPERDLFTQLAGAAPDSGMRTPTWLRFVSEIFDNDLEMIEFLQRLMGYCLTGDRREQKLVFFHGSGANGKSVLVDEVLALMGRYALNLPSEALMRQRHQGHPTELAQLRGKRLAVSSELEDSAYWAESRIKALTGDATLPARFMRQDFFEFRQTQKHIVVGNFKPRLNGDDPAIARRMLLVPFNRVFSGAERDPLLSERLARERPGILAWAIAGAVKWARDGLLIPATVRNASAEYLSEHDDMALWLEDCCAVGRGNRALARDLYQSFFSWKQAAGEHAQSQRGWGDRMAKRFTQYRTNSGRGYEGVTLCAQQSTHQEFSYANRRG